jgi:hypothetical protein
MDPGEGLAEAVGLGIDDEIDVPLAIEGDLLGAVAGHGAEAQALEERPSAGASGAVYSHELEPSVPMGLGHSFGATGMQPAKSPEIAVWNELA